MAQRPAYDEQGSRIRQLEENHADLQALMAGQTVALTNLDEKFDRVDAKLDRVLEIGQRVTVLEEARSRTRATVKWVAGVIATVVSAVVLAKLGLS